MRRILTQVLATLLLALFAWGAAQSGVLRYHSYTLDPAPRALDEKIG